MQPRPRHLQTPRASCNDLTALDISLFLEPANAVALIYCMFFPSQWVQEEVYILDAARDSMNDSNSTHREYYHNIKIRERKPRF